MIIFSQSTKFFFRLGASVALSSFQLLFSLHRSVYPSGLPYDYSIGGDAFQYDGVGGVGGIGCVELNVC